MDEDISLEAVDRPPSSADEESDGEEYLVGEVQASEACVADEVLEHALDVVLRRENVETIQIGADDTDVMDDCGFCNFLVYKQLDDVFGNVHCRDVDQYL